MMKTYDYLFKIILIGESDVGKTNILDRFSDDTFSHSYIPTIGVDLKIRSIDLDGKIIKLYMWDTAGHERFQTIRTSFYRGAMGIMLIYDICNAESFDRITGFYTEIQQHASLEVEIMLVGNKSDMEDKRQVNKDRGERLAAEHGMKFMEVSALASSNIEEALFTLERTIKDTKEGANGSDDCEHEDGSDDREHEDRDNVCVVQ